MPADPGPVSLLVPTLIGGGAERVMVDLANIFAARGERVDLVVFTADGPFKSRVEAGVRLVDLGTVRARSTLPALTRYLRRERPQSLLATHPRACVLAVAARALSGVRMRVVSREPTTFSVNARALRGIGARLMPPAVRWAYRRSDAVVAVSQGSADDLEQNLGIPAEHVHVIPNPVVTPTLRRMAAAPLHDDPWFAPGEPPTLLGVGQFAPRKDFPTLLRAFALLAPSSPARLLLLGEGPGRPELERLAAELGVAERVRMPGFVDNPYRYMSHAAAFVLSSGWEGLPGALIEAMACGCPVVSTDCPSGPREILEGGRFGPLVPVGDAQALADAILVVLADPLPADELRAATERYAYAAAADRYQALLQPGGQVAARESLAGTAPRP